LRKIYEIWFVEKITFDRNNLFQKKFFKEQIFIKNCFKKKLNFCIRMWLMAYKINICNPFRKIFDSFWIKSILMEKLLLLVLLRPKNFVRHFQGLDMKCKLPLSTNNLALLSLLSFWQSVIQSSSNFVNTKNKFHSYTITTRPLVASGTRD
jgi:hypothetical protein